MRRYSPLCFAVSLFLLAIPYSSAQTSGELVQVIPPSIQHAQPPSPDASAQELEQEADLYREKKDLLDALDYFRAALAKEPKNARIENKIGITELVMLRYPDAKKSFEHAIKLDHQFADAYNNLGVTEYELRKYGKAIKLYEKALELRKDCASYFANEGAAYYSKKEFEKAGEAYGEALRLDPTIFERTSRTGVAAQLPPNLEERAHFDYLVARLFAKEGDKDRSLQYLRRAMEEGYKQINNVYKDPEFEGLRSDARFTELMAAKPPAIPE